MLNGFVTADDRSWWCTVRSVAPKCRPQEHQVTCRRSCSVGSHSPRRSTSSCLVFFYGRFVVFPLSLSKLASFDFRRHCLPTSLSSPRQIFTREVPFQGYDVADIRRKVLAGERFRVPTIDCPEPCQVSGKTPTTSSSQPPQCALALILMRNAWTCLLSSLLQLLMRTCWDAEPSKRPTFNEIRETLRSISIPVQHLEASSSVFEGDALDGLLRGK